MNIGHLHSFGDGIHAIDSGFGRPLLDAVHVIEHEGRAALVDAAVNASVPRVLGALAALGIARDAVDYILLTHVHLDHAGGAGLLMRELPNAKLTVHPRGARHMIDPAKLTTATHAVYGQGAAMYSDILPVPRERVVRRRTARCWNSPAANCCSSTRRAMRATMSASATASPGTSSPATPSASCSANSTSAAAATPSRR
jgi:hypothetical protein